MNNAVIVAGIDAVSITIPEASTVERDAALAASKVVGAVADPITRDVAHEALVALVKICKEVEASRLSVTRPIDALKKRVMETAAKFTDEAEREVLRLKGLLTEYQRKLDAEAQAEAKRQEAAQKAEEERLRKEAEAQAAAAQPGAPVSTPESTVAPAPATTPAPAKPQTLFVAPTLQAPAKLAGSMTRRPWKYKVEDMGKLFAARPDLCRLEEVPSLVNAAIAGGLRECPGLTIYQDVQVGVRV